MRNDASLPSYELLFGDLDLREGDEARSVYSPAAYLVDLLNLMRGSSDETAVLRRRPDIGEIPLDKEHTFTVTPYLDIVNEVLEELVGDDPYGQLLRIQHPFALPFSFTDARTRVYLRHLGIDPVEFHRLFAARVDRDRLAREYLGLSAVDVEAVTAVRTDEVGLAERYGRPTSQLSGIETFLAAASMTGAELTVLLASRFNEGVVTVAPDDRTLRQVSRGWLDKVNRFVRLSRRTGLSFADLDVVLASCAGGVIDLRALTALAAAVHLHRTHDLGYDVIAGLTSRAMPGTVDDVPAPPGDLLAPQNRDYRLHLARTLDLAESDLVTVVQRFRDRYATPLEAGPFDKGIGEAALSLLHRVSRLVAALGVSVEELFTLLSALDADPALRRYTTFPVLPVLHPGTADCYRILEGSDAQSSLWLTQTLLAVTSWMREWGFGARDLAEVLGEPATPESEEEQQAVLAAIRDRFETVALGPGLFVSDRFDGRAAQVVYDVLAAYADGVVSPRDPRLLRLDPEAVGAAAYDAVTDVAVLAKEDFQGLGLADRLIVKIFSNLVTYGLLGADGVLATEEPPEEPVLSGDYDDLAGALFAVIASLDGALYPSDLAAHFPQLSEPERAELYGNLVYHGHLDDEGQVADPAFFADPANEPLFTASADLGDVTEAVLGALAERVERFGQLTITLGPGVFDGLGLTEAQLAALVESLRFNGVIDAHDAYVSKELPDDLGLTLEFYPIRRLVVEAMRDQISAVRTELYTFVPDDFAPIAEDAVGRRIAGLLDGAITEEGRVREEARELFGDPEGRLDLGAGFTAADGAVVYQRISEILDAQRPYRLDLDAVAALGFTEDERAQLVELLTATGDLDAALGVPWDRLGYFATVTNALDFTLPGAEDYGMDVFFLLHTVAVEIIAAVDEVAARLAGLATAQREALPAVLQDAFGVPAQVAEVICDAVAADAFDVLVAPALTGDTLDPHFRRTYRRIRRFARLAAKLGLDATEAAVSFHDQDLAGKFPEPLALPPGIDRFDALLTGWDGKLYLFQATNYWVYSAATHVLADPRAKQLAELSANFGTLAGVDAAFVRPDGVEWIIGRGLDGLSHAFTRDPGGTRWAPREQVWGKVRNNFTDPKRIDNVFVDGDGRTYVFSGDQYVRYSTDDFAYVDEGYPRSIGEWWEGEGRDAPLPEAFRHVVDAAFQGRDGRTHVFSGERWSDGGAEAPIAERWGLLRNTFDGAERIDAAYADGEGCLLFRGDQVVRYTDSLENEGVRVADGYPRRIESWRPEVPAEFENAVEAAFQDGSGTVHLFRDGKTVALSPSGAGPVTPTAERWGLMRPVLTDGRVNAAFVGLDGRTYLFSGDRYVRYSTADYSIVDVGYPRAIAGDWGGLDRVDAAFVMDGATHLFGPAGLILDLPADYEAELASGRLSAALRRRLREHHVTTADDARVTGTAGDWRVVAEGGIALTIRRAGDRIKVYGDDTPFYVRYSTRDYRVPDAGYPRPLADNWWNLPATLTGHPGFGGVDAVFTDQDNRTVLFSGGSFVVFDGRHRWWSEPYALADRWDSLPFREVDAAFVGKDGRTYVFSGGEYARYSTGDYSRLDDRFPSSVSAFWGNVVNNVARTGRVDATLVMDAVEKVDGVEVTRTYTYLFSGDQYVRYLDHDYSAVQDGYPRALSSLREEPRLGSLAVVPAGVDAAFADRRNVYLFRDGEWHVVSDTVYRKYGELALSGLSCAFVENGAVLVERAGAWSRQPALEGRPQSPVPYRPLTLRAVPEDYRTGLDAVLTGRDGTTYLFKGPDCYNTAIDKVYPLAEEWGRPRNTIYQDNAVDAAFVGRDGKTYLFRGDQFVVYGASMETIEGEPRPIADHWGGLTSVALAYDRHGVTYLFEHPDESGAMRHVVYTGERGAYTRPDEGYPAPADESFWKAPDPFPFPQAVLFENDTMLLLAGERYVQLNEETGQWSYPRPIERVWRGFGRGAEPGDTLRTAFTAADGSTYFFFTEHYTRYHDRAFSPLLAIRDRWGRAANPFVPDEGGSVDAAIVFGDDATFLFSGKQYVRYTGGEYRYVDPGYPKAIAVNLRAEPEFAGLPETFEDAVAGRRIDAAVANGRNAYLVVNGELHVVSRAATATYELGLLGRVRNAIAERERVDAALVRDQQTFLFSGDQYVRYTGRDYRHADDGYPRTIAGSLAAELGLPALPPEFEAGLDAAFRAHDRRVYLFKGKKYLVDGRVADVAGQWGTVFNRFTERAVVDAAFVAPTGELYAFRGKQYVRYSGALDVVDEGYPRTIDDDWGDLPAPFEEGITGACVLEGVTYLLKDELYMRYPGRYDLPDWTFAQPIRHRWSETADYRLTDVHTISLFAELAHARPGLADVLWSGAPDPYERLAALFGWDVDELRWVKRNAGLITEFPVEEERFEIEFLLKLVKVFALAARAGTGPSRLYQDAWTRPDPAEALALMLRRKLTDQEWELVSRTVRDELNVIRRDALVPAALHKNPDLDGARELYERLLVDVEMGPEGNTSHVREAVAAVQLYVHRYLLDLEKVLPDDEELRRRVRVWWSWLKNYRVWEANRKVFLYPENYLRPELRDTKTPAFRELENDLLQNEIGADSVQAAYKRYLDEYTEVSRLSVAGGYVYRADGADENVRRLVLFGRTRTEPRRHYYREAEFRDGERLSATWQPWLKVDAQIDGDRVYPVHAFGRVFVFWPVVETVPPDTTGTTTIVARRDGDKQNVEPQPSRYRVRISYSFYNLNKEWVSAQELPLGPAVDFPISDLRLSVQASATVPGGDPGAHDSIVVSCSYLVTVPGEPGGPPKQEPRSVAYALTPELYAVPVATPAEPSRLVELSKIFAEPSPLDPAGVVPFSNAAGSQDGTWFSVDHKGGSFLCRPVIPDPAGDPRPLPVAGNGDGVPEWDVIDAGFELGDTRYFFRQGQYRPAGASDKIADRWGHARSALATSASVDAMLVRDGVTYVFAGSEYYCYDGAPFGLMLPGYPKTIATNDDTLPRWPKIDAAYTADGVEYFYSGEHGFTSSNVLKGTASSWSPDLDLGWLSPPPKDKDPKDRRAADTPAVPQLDALLLRKGIRNRNILYVIAGTRYARYTGSAKQPDEEPKALADSGDDNLPRTGKVHAAYCHGTTSYFFDNEARTYAAYTGKTAGPAQQTAALGRVPTAITRTGRVDAAYLDDAGHLYLTSGTEYVRYTVENGVIPDHIDDDYPKELSTRVRAVFKRGDRHYVFGDRVYAVLAAGQELAGLDRTAFLGIEGSWRSLPPGFTGAFTGAMDAGDKLLFFLGTRYIAYPKGVSLLRPYEFASLQHEIVRLTSSTAFELNRRLLVGGVPALLAPDTQETDELPAFSTTVSGPATIKVTADVAGTPAGTHLDFQSANGRYYWEIFFHAPLLIAQALNTGQRFEDARRWYEYVFDPTEDRYWRFLPFLAIDVRALVDGCLADLDALKPAGVESGLRQILDDVTDLIPAFEQARELTGTELDHLAELETETLPPILTQLATLTGDLARSLREKVGLLARLRRQYDLMGDHGALLAAYRDDPFDPHAIAELRPSAYRRAVVMAYVDNLLDWGDLLFGQHTMESIDEARMLYVLAYDLLGRRPEGVGTRTLEATKTYDGLRALEAKLPPDPDAVRLTAGGTLLDGLGLIHKSVADGYFYIPGNTQLGDYWTRVEDRLRKIRASLDLMGVSRPLPLFEPPADVMALVTGASAGLSPDQSVNGLSARVPHQRFAATFRKAQELVDRLRQFGADLLATLEKRDSEELTLLHSRQESAILAMTRAIKEAQVKAATETLRESEAALAAAIQRRDWYDRLLDEGISPLQIAQLATMGGAVYAHYASTVLKVASGLTYLAPNVYLGPFIMGIEEGGTHAGEMIDKGADAVQTAAEGLSVLGELFGVRAEQERQIQEWEFQSRTAKADIVQLGHQVAGAGHQLAVARRELEITNKEIAHAEAVVTFLTGKFTGVQLYQWMSGRLASLYFQSYHLALETAKAAERAYQYERGVNDTILQPVYWDSRRKGLLAGETLAVDLDRLGKAYADGDARGLEIVKRVSLLQLDPLAMLKLRSEGRCEFALTEALFARDFPGHYRRRIKTVSVTFTAGEEPIGVNATLTQLGHKTVLAADSRAVRFLLDAKGSQPDTVRADWRPGQQIVLSDLEQGRDNNGLFELRYDDDRYLPFEGTGAVSTWRLESDGPPPDLFDVIVTVKYTAEQGGVVFGNAVKGMLKPYPAGRYIDVAGEFPEEWQHFLESGDGVLALPLTPEMFPGMNGRQITAVYAKYETDRPGAARLLLNGDQRLALHDGTAVRTPGLSVGGTPLTLVADGDRTALVNAGLILSYRAV